MTFGSGRCPPCFLWTKRVAVAVPGPVTVRDLPADSGHSEKRRQRPRLGVLLWRCALALEQPIHQYSTLCLQVMVVLT